MSPSKTDLTKFRERFEDEAHKMGIDEPCTLDVDDHGPEVRAEPGQCHFRFDFGILDRPPMVQREAIRMALRVAFGPFDRVRSNPPYSGYRSCWYLKGHQTQMPWGKLCYKTKTAALLVFLDANRQLVDDYGGENTGLPASFDAINNRYNITGKRRVDTIGKAVWWALPGPKPWCLEDIDVELLNQTAPAQHNPRGLAWRLPDHVEEARLAEQEEEYWAEQYGDVEFPEEEPAEEYPASWNAAFWDEPVEAAAEPDYPASWDVPAVENEGGRYAVKRAVETLGWQKLETTPCQPGDERVECLPMENPSIFDSETSAEYVLPEGLSALGSDRAKCDDCGRWAWAGEKLRHSSRCDTPNLQPISASAADHPAVRWTKTEKGQRVIVGPVSEVFEGAQITVDGEEVLVGGVGRLFTRGGVEVRYGYPTHESRGSRRTVVHAARDGSAYAEGYDDDDLLLAVQSGVLSVSDAMNQDF